MAKLNVIAFKKLVNTSRSKVTFLSCAAKEKMTTAVASWVQVLDSNNEQEPPLDFHAVDSKEDGFTKDDLSLNKAETDEKNSTVVVNWLINLVTKLWERVTEHSQLIKFNFSQAEAKEAEMDGLKAEVEKLRKHCEEVQQRSMKGNLIISSPNRTQKPSLLTLKTLKVNGETVKEDATDLCCRLIEEKTGVFVPKQDISACHMLKKQGDESSYIIRFHNLKHGSAWASITAGLMTGKVNGQCFTDANVYINYQVTKARGELLKQARLARKDGSIRKYSTDQNGNISVQIDQRSPWTRITSPSHLRQFISAGSRQQAPAVRDAWRGQHK